MAHNLDFTQGSASMFYNSQNGLPWHGLGTACDGAQDSKSAAIAAKLDKPIVARPLQYDDGTTMVTIPGKFAIIRDCGEYSIPLGVVGDRYSILQDCEAFSTLDQLASAGETIRYETAGAIANGSKVWMLAQWGQSWEIAKNDVLHDYILLFNGHDGLTPITLCPTNVRAVCQNTINLALDTRTLGYTIRHTESHKQRLSEIVISLRKMREARQLFQERAKFLASKYIDNTLFFANAIDSFAPISHIALQRGIDEFVKDATSIEDRERLARRFEKLSAARHSILNDVLVRFDSTTCDDSAWGAFNAITEHIDHGSTFRFNGDSLKRRESRMVALIQGKQAELKTGAFNLALQLAS